MLLAALLKAFDDAIRKSEIEIVGADETDRAMSQLDEVIHGQSDGGFAIQIDVGQALVIARAPDQHEGDVGFAQQFDALVLLLNAHQQHAVDKPRIDDLA